MEKKVKFQVNFQVKFLKAEEKIIAQSPMHWVIFAAPLLLYLASLILFFCPMLFGDFFGTCLVIIASVWVFYSLSCYFGLKLILTNQRLLLRSGIISPRYVGYFLNDIANIESEESTFGKMMGYGSLIVTLNSKKTYILKYYTETSSFLKKINENISISPS